MINVLTVTAGRGRGRGIGTGYFHILLGRCFWGSAGSEKNFCVLHIQKFFVVPYSICPFPPLPPFFPGLPKCSMFFRIRD